jgi:integrase
MACRMPYRMTKVTTAGPITTTTAPRQEKQSPSFYSPRRLKLYTLAEIEHCETSKTIMKYIEAKMIQDKNTGMTYKTRMQSFAQFVYRRYNKTPVDDFLEQIKAGKYDPYDILTEYSGFLKNERPSESKLTANVIRARVKTARKFFRFNKIVVTVDDFNELVPLPRKEQRSKKGIDKTNVARYLNACKNIQLKTALHVMASNGPRPIELCAARECDVNLDSDPATITYTAEYSKMRVARTRPLTREAANQLRLWDKFKYRTRWTTVKDEENGESVRRFAAPKRNPYNLLLSMPHLNDEKATPAPPPPTCNADSNVPREETATIVGTSGDDNIVGTPNRDVIAGLGGNDRIIGLGGDDLICGGDGNDVILGGDGNDVILGEAGNDFTIFGGDGNDLLLGGADNDFLDGQTGTDRGDGGPGFDACINVECYQL